MNDWDLYVYSYIPNTALKAVLKEGLYSGEALLKRPDLLALAAKGRKISTRELEKSIKKNLSSWSKESSLGPNVVFSLIPKSIKLSKNHPTKKFDLIPIKINITQVLREYPNTKIFGMELKPYEQSKDSDERHYFLSKMQFFKLLMMEPEEIWSRYNDIEDKGLYAPDVPHAAILIDNGIIPGKYLSKVDKNKSASEQFNFAIFNLKLLKNGNIY